MFKCNVRDMFVGACCAAVMMCGGVSGMEDMHKSSLKEPIDSNALLTYGVNAQNEYGADSYFDRWKTDGERFLTQDFITKCVNGKSIPLLNDGRPEFIEWLYGTNQNSVFFAKWGWETRYEFAKPFIQLLLETYLKHEQLFESYIPCIKTMLEVLDSTEKL
jgi:hypothetical protein